MPWSSPVMNSFICGKVISKSFRIWNSLTDWCCYLSFSQFINLNLNYVTSRPENIIWESQSTGENKSLVISIHIAISEIVLCWTQLLMDNIYIFDRLMMWEEKIRWYCNVRLTFRAFTDFFILSSSGLLRLVPSVW